MLIILQLKCWIIFGALLPKFQHHWMTQYRSFLFCPLLWIAMKRRIYLLTYLETTWCWPHCMACSCLWHVPHSPQDALSHSDIQPHSEGRN